MEHEALSHENTKLIYFWVKPEVFEKFDQLSKYCNLTKGQLLDQIIEGLDNRYFNELSISRGCYD